MELDRIIRVLSGVALLSSTLALAKSEVPVAPAGRTAAAVGGGCTDGNPTVLCVQNGRFRVKVDWKNPYDGGSTGVGTAIQLTNETGYFWFFQDTNVELMLKILDGRTTNGKFWVLFGALSDVEYTITITDTVTSAVKTYYNPPQHLGSFIDIEAFSGRPAAAQLVHLGDLPGTEAFWPGATERLPRESLARAPGAAGAPSAADASIDPLAACATLGPILCLNQSRFQVQVAWHDPYGGSSGVGTAVQLTSDTGYFWFFVSTNVELVIKVLDGRLLNGHFWVLYGALSDVEYTITVTDTKTSAVKTYYNPPKHLGSAIDILAFTEAAELVINPLSLPSGVVNTAYPTTTFSQTGGTGAITWSLTGTLPTGMTFSPLGILSGTPTQLGSFPIAVKATDAGGLTGSRNYTLVVNCPTGITIAPTTLPTVFVGNAFPTVTFTQTGATNPVTWSLSAGTLPSGMTLSAGGVLSGTPTQGGSFAITVKVTDVNGCFATASMTLLVNGCPSITVNPPLTQLGFVGSPYNFPFSQTGGATPIAWSVSGKLPQGLVLNATTGFLTGIPTESGIFPITVKATDVNGCVGTRLYSLRIDCPNITIGPASMPTGVVGSAYPAFGFTQSGGTPGIFNTWQVTSGTFPPGLVLNAGSGAVTGIPTTAGLFSFVLKFTDPNGCSSSRPYTVRICPVVGVAPPTLTAGLVGTPYNQSVSGTGGVGPYTFALTAGALPAGLALAGGTGAITGTPTVPGNFTFTITATDSNGCFGSQVIALTINQVPAITSANAVTFQVGVAGTFTVTTTGFPTPTITRGGVALPAGVTFVDNGNGTGTLAGTPAAATGGAYAITFTAANGVPPNALQNFTLTVNQPPAITSANAVTFQTGVAGTFTVTTTGFPVPGITRGGVALPGGVTFTDNGNGTGTLAGTPAAGTGGTYAISFTAANGVLPNAVQPFTLTVNQPPSITSPNNIAFQVGVAGTFTVTTTGFPVSAITRGGVALPGGVTFVDNGNGTGTLAGTPAAASGGTYAISFTAANGVAPNAVQPFTLTVNDPPVITSANAVTFTVGVAGTFTVTTTGFPVPGITRGGVALPGGVTFVDNGNGTGTLAGTPAALTGGTYAITFTAANGVTPNAVQNFTLTVNQAPAITSPNNVAFQVGVAGTFTVTTTGFPVSAITRGGVALPGGVTYVDNGNGTGTLAGTPAAATGGTYAISFTAANGVAPNAVQPFTLTVNQPPAITSANAVTFTVGVAGTFTVTTTGFPVSAITRGGVALPGGVTYVDNGNGTGTLAGTPAAATGGTYAISFTAANGVAPNAVQPFTLTVNQAPAITSANNVTFGIGIAGTFTVTTTGFPVSTITRGGVALPGGITFVDNGDGTATLSGTAAAGTGGTYAISFTAANGVAPNAVQPFTLTINQAPTITSAANATFQVGVAGTFTVTTTGFPTTVALSEVGALPAGVTFVDNGNGTATLAGTPGAGTGAAYPIVITGNNGVAPNATQNFTLTVNQPPAITSLNNTTFTVGTPGAFTVTTTGFPTGASMVITEVGALPGGLTFTNNGNGTATIGGTPLAGTGGVYLITLGASNGVAPNASQPFALTVNQAPAITSAATTTFTVGAAGTFTVTTSGFPPLVALSEVGALPAGVTFVDNLNGTATLAGTPGAGTGGTYPIVITGNNGVAPNATQNFTLTINQAPAITSANASTFPPGVPTSFTVTTTGFPTGASMVITQTGALPSGVTFTDNNNGTATIAGTASGSGSFPIVITAANGVAPNATQNHTIQLQQIPTITSANSTAFTVGSPGTFTVTTTGVPTPSIARGGVALPAGVTFVDNGNGTGTLAGTPGAGTGGTYAITFTATNIAGSSPAQAFTLTINQAPTVSSANNVTFTVGAAGTFTVTTTGFPAPSIAQGGVALPGGVTFTDNGNGTGTLAGTPSAGTGGTYAITFTATNVAGSSPAQAFTLTIRQAPAVTSANATTFRVGVAGSFTVTTSGFPLPSIARGGVALPGGVTFVDNGNGTGTLAGTPAAATGGSYAITFTATNVVGSSPAQAFTLTVEQAPVITSANNVTFTVGAAGTFTVTTTGFPAPSIAQGGVALPGGVTFTDNGNGTGTLAGTPAAGTGGTYAITFTATNVVGSTPAQAFTLTIRQLPAVTSANNVTFQVGVAGTFTVTTSGFPLPSIARGGVALPGGVTFTDNGNGTGTLAGTPAAATGGTYAITFTATNVVGSSPAQAFTLTVNQPPAITSANNTTFTAGVAGSFTVTSTGFPARTFSATNLPAWATMSAGGVLSGTPPNTTGSPFNTIVITATNGVLPDATQNFTLTVVCPTITLLPAPGAVTAGTFNVAGYSQLFTASGGLGAYTYAIAPGIPAGLAFNTGTGALTGTPNATGTFSFTVQATDNSTGCQSALQAYTLAILPNLQNDAYSGVGNTQLFITGVASAPATPAVQSATTALSNDTPGGGVTITAGTIACGGIGGSLTIDALGRFLYTPPVTTIGAATCVYTGTSNTGATPTPTSATATITITLTNRVWYVNGAAAGDGRSQSPSNLTTVNTAHAAGDFIFVHSAGAPTSTPGAITLKANVTLWGQGNALPAIGGIAIQNTGATSKPSLANTVTVGGAGVTISSLDISTGASAGISASGALGTLTIQNAVTVTTSTGTGVAFSNATGTVNANTTSISATGNGTAFSADLGTANINWGGTITSATGRTISVTNRTGGSAAFSGAVSGGGTGIQLLNNTGSTNNFVGGISLSTGPNDAFTATGGGGVRATQNNTTIVNTLTTTTGTALNVANTTIAVSGLTFRSISSNGAASGIVLNNTGSSGGLTLTGNSSGLCGGQVGSGPPASPATATAPTSGDCSGGTIQNTTGPGIVLTNTANVSLTRLWLRGSGNDGIQATNVTGFTLTSSLVENNGNAVTEANLDFGDAASLTPDGLHGVGSITNSTVQGAFERNVVIRNFNGAALTALNISGSQFRNVSANTQSDDGILVEAAGTANMTVTVSGSYFAANRGDHFQAAALNSGTLTVTLSNNTLTGGHSTALGQGITINAATGVAFGGYTGRIDYDINGNNINGAISNGVSVVLGTSGASAVFDGFVRNNVIGTSGSSLSGSTQANGVYIDARGNGTHQSAVTGNTIRQCFDRGILSEAGDGSGVLGLTVQSNIIDQQVDAAAREAIQTNYGITSTNVFGVPDAPTVCLQLGGAGVLANTFTHGGGAPDDFRLRKRFGATVRLPGYAGGTDQSAPSLAQVVTFIQGQNTGSAGEPGSASASGIGGGYTGGAACPLPSP